MPFYEYACSSCGAATEILQKLSDPPETECPVCHSAALVKQVSAAGFRLKGGGWYETDFKGKAQRGADGEAKPAEAGAAAAGAAAAGGHSCAAGGCSHTPKTATKSSEQPAPTAST